MTTDRIGLVSTAASAFAESVAHYSRLLPAHGLQTSSCWTIVQPLTVNSVVRLLGGHPDDLELLPLHAAFDLTDGGGDVCVYHFGQIGPAVVIYENNGFQGSRWEVLEKLSSGARVHSAFWNLGAHNSFTYAVYGKVVTSFDALSLGEFHGTDPTALDADLALAADAFDDESVRYQAALMALLELRTGVRITDSWLALPHRALMAEAL